MKKILYPIFLPLLFIAACKKDFTNTPQTPGDSGTGLEKLVSPSAQNYCVLVITDNQGFRDTIIWQNTTDTSYGSRGAGGTTNNYYYMASSVFKPKVVEKFQNFSIGFRKKIPAPALFPCNYIDSALKMGTLAVNNDNIFITVTDNFGLAMVDIPMSGSAVEVLSKETGIQTTGSCIKVRAKVKLTNIQFGPFGCIVPPYNINEGVVQMEY